MDSEKLMKYRKFFRDRTLDSEEKSEYYSILFKNFIGLSISLSTIPYTRELSQRFNSYNYFYGGFLKFAVISFLPIVTSVYIKNHYFYPFYEKVYIKHHPIEDNQTFKDEEKEKAEDSFN